MTTGEANAGDLIGQLLGGRYRVTSVVGRGGMGVVARAVDELLNREVAVKVLRAYTDASPHELAGLRVRMQREAQAAARIRHSGVVTVHDVTEERGLPVIVMELVHGPSLDDVLTERGTLPPHEVAAIGAKLMDALDAAHRVGVLHRDVKPGNVLLERGERSEMGVPPAGGWGRVVLTDFGIASMDTAGDDAMDKLTRSGQIVGSLDYLPPERAQGREPGPASDIWSLGMTLYAAVEGAAPFRRTSAWSTLAAIVTEPLPEPRQAGPLTPVLRALMAKEPESRPTADQARAMLEQVAAGGTAHVAPPGPLSPPAPQAFAVRTPTEAAIPTPPPGFGPAPAHPAAHPVHPQPGAPYAGPGVPAGETSRIAARRARRRGRTLTASVAAVALLAAGGGITYALTAKEDAPAANVAQPSSPGVSSPADSPQPSAGSTPSSAASPSSSAQPSPSKEKEEDRTTKGPTTKPKDDGSATASTSPKATPSSTVKEPTPVSTACTGWARQNNSDGYGYVSQGTHLYTGPYSECSYVTAVKSGVKVHYHCYVTNAHGNKWIYARIDGTSTEGWIFSDKSTLKTGSLVRC
ncbi:serine/threonine-protein kinase [Streptomyces purpureus]|uniref:serine/threonine-protein kinase n=1 Tax=Streptomyces purpureus TaxID=1951 RepID=UPI0037A6E338